MAHNDECTVLSAAFPDGETVSLTLGELKAIKQLANDLQPMAREEAEERGQEAKPKRGRSRR